MKKHEKSPSAVFKSGGVVIFPTDTVYGIGCKFDNIEGIERIYKIKGTPKIQNFPVLVSNISQVEKIADINNVARQLMEKHWPGGLTIILPVRHDADPSLSLRAKRSNLYSKESSYKIGFRMPNLASLQKIINDVGPIIGTSANIHGKKAPTSQEELDPKLISLADYVIRGECKKGIESTVVDTTVEPPKILRQGTVKL
ncbi:MAG: L-threonylcarbamoyladenylate synthase [Candidatus Curtissbacteria bacterium]|nr:L-threonylcarbamoyladenylate synthase [Candidatus Curtissbacteria bacterium]